MFIYLVALVATLFIIFGLVRGRCLPVIETTLNNDSENTLTTETPWTAINERVEYEELSSQRTAFGNKERSSDAILGETGSKARSFNPPRYSFEDILSEERDKDLGLPAGKTLQLGAAQANTTRTPKQEGKEPILESLKSSIERSPTSPYSRLNTSQIYNLILKEKLKENVARQRLTETDMNKINESSPVKITDDPPASFETTSEHQDD